jgi:hypothetical protein
MARLNVLKSFYASTAWQNFRLIVIAERGLRCEHCGRLIANPIEVILHHKIELTPENVHDVNIALNPDNILLVCRDCHDKIHGRFGYHKAKAVYIVYGCPLSGKRTYVSQNIMRGDMVISMDSLYEAITGLPAYDKPDSLLINVKSVYNLLIDQVKTRYGKWNNAYIIGGFADRYKREPLAEDLGADLIYCECTKEEAVSRIDLDEHRRNMKADYVRYIGEWFEQFSA